MKHSDVTVNTNMTLSSLFYAHYSREIPESVHFLQQFREVRFDKFLVNISNKDNCVKFDGGIVLVRNILKTKSEILVVYQTFCSKKSLFDYPAGSSCFGIHNVSNLEQTLKSGPITYVQNKFVILPFKSDFVVLPLLHSL